jgi:acyl-coenzyme A synthetase/AMP-(fatty) acid ligase
MEIHLLATLTASSQVFLPSHVAIASPLKFFECIATHRVTYSFAPNFFLTAVCNSLKVQPEAKYDLCSLRRVVSGGEANLVSTGIEFNAWVEQFGGSKNVLTMAYGLTEVCRHNKMLSY